MGNRLKIGFLLPTRVNYMELLTPGFGIAQPWTLWAFGNEPANGRSPSFYQSTSLYQSTSHISKYKFLKLEYILAHAFPL